MTIKTTQIRYNGRMIDYQSPLGIYLDKEITGRIHDHIIPKYRELSPEKLTPLNPESIRIIRDDAKRQLEGIAQKDTREVQRALQNTLNLTTSMLKK